MTTRTYREWEKPGRRKWRSADFLARVCNTTGVSAGWMLEGCHWQQPPSPLPVTADGAPMPKGPRMIVSDPDQIAFLEAVRALPPEARDRLNVLRQAITKRRSAHVIRTATLGYLAAIGVPQWQAVMRADRFMRGLNAARTKDVTEAC